jgi:hypothetical protein
MIDWLRRRAGERRHERRPTPEPLTEPISLRRELGPRDQGLTAREAYALAEPELLALDPSAQPHLITCPDVQPDGRARLWEIGFLLPGRLATGIVELAVELDEAGDPTWLTLQADIRPVVTSGSLLDQAIRRANLDARGLQEIWRATLPSVPLPLPFRDSPEAVASLATQGVDLVSGPTDVPLSTRVLDDGRVVWEIALRRRTYRTPLR